MPSVFLICLQARHRDRIFEVRMPSGITSVEHLFLQLWKMRPREGQSFPRPSAGLLPRACPCLLLTAQRAIHIRGIMSVKMDLLPKSSPPNSEKAGRNGYDQLLFFRTMEIGQSLAVILRTFIPEKQLDLDDKKRFCSLLLSLLFHH